MKKIIYKAIFVVLVNFPNAYGVITDQKEDEMTVAQKYVMELSEKGEYGSFLQDGYWEERAYGEMLSKDEYIGMLEQLMHDNDKVQQDIYNIASSNKIQSPQQFCRFYKAIKSLQIDANKKFLYLVEYLSILMSPFLSEQLIANYLSFDEGKPLVDAYNLSDNNITKKIATLSEILKIGSLCVDQELKDYISSIIFNNLNLA